MFSLGHVYVLARDQKKDAFLLVYFKILKYICKMEKIYPRCIIVMSTLPINLESFGATTLKL